MCALQLPTALDNAVCIPTTKLPLPSECFLSPQAPVTPPLSGRQSLEAPSSVLPGPPLLASPWSLTSQSS